MQKEKIQIDRISITININHNPEKLSSCFQIYSDEKYCFDDAGRIQT